MPGADRTFFETLRTIEQDRRRGVLLGYEIRDRAHLFVAVDGFGDAHKLADPVDVRQPLA